MQVILKIRSKDKESESAVLLGQTATLGRSRSCDIQVEDEKISGRHCQFHLKVDRLEVIDLDSKNGTYLNGIRIERSEMFLGDEIEIGNLVLSLEESKMQPVAIQALTFPGPFSDRLNYELKADFTGARIKNQLNLKTMPKHQMESESHTREIVLRKKIKSGLKVSKQEIRLQNSFVSLVATFLDALALLGVIILPLLTAGSFIPQGLPSEQKVSLLVAVTLILALAFVLLNFKKMKFTVGERIAGVKDLYDKQ